MKTILLILFFYSLALIQISFLPYFNIQGITLNLILILVIFLPLFNQNPIFLIRTSISGGFFLDVFSPTPFGFHVLILLGVTFLIKIIIKKYLRSPIFTLD